LCELAVVARACAVLLLFVAVLTTQSQKLTAITSHASDEDFVVGEVAVARAARAWGSDATGCCGPLQASC
jgi:hypothetical protein